MRFPSPALAWQHLHWTARAGLIFAALLLVYWLALAVWLPWWLRGQLPGWVSGALADRQFAVAGLRIHPFDIAVEADGLTLNEADGAPLLSLGALRADVAVWKSLTTLALVIDEVWLDKPAVQVVRQADGQINLLALVPPAEPEASDAPPPAIPPVLLRRLVLDQGQVDYWEGWAGGRYQRTLEDIHLRVRDLDARQGQRGQWQFSLRGDAGEQLALAGVLGVQPLAVEARLALADVPLQALAPRLPAGLPAKPAAGRVSLAAGLSVSLDDKGAPVLALRDGRAALDGLDVVDASNESLARLALLRVEDIALEWPAQRASVRQLRLAGFDSAVRRLPDGRIDLLERLQLAEAPAPAVASPAPAPAPAAPAPAPAPALQPAAASAVAPWQFSLGEFLLEDSGVLVEDQAVQPAFSTRLSSLRLRATEVSLDLSRPVPLEFSTRLAESGQLAVKGAITPQPLSAALEVALETLPLSSLQPYLQQAIALRLEDGRLGLQLKVDYRQAEGDRLQVSGDANLASLLLKEQGVDRDIAAARTLSASGIRFDTAPLSLNAAKVLADGAYARVVLNADGTSNLQTLVKRADAAQAAAPAQPTTRQAGKRAKDAPASTAPPAVADAAKTPDTVPLAFAIDRIDVRDSSAYFADYSIKPRFATAIERLNGQVSGLSSAAGARATIDLKGEAGPDAPVVLAGTVAPFARDLSLDLGISFRNLDLTAFSPYSGTFAGYRIDKGKLTLDLRYTIQERRLAGENRVFLDQFTLGERVQSERATSLPVKLAIALLKNDRGEIDIDLPVRGSLDDPQFSVGGLVLRALVNLVKKAVTAPFTLLAGLVGGGEGDLDKLYFAAGNGALEEAQADKLDSLAKALNARPVLRLEIRGAAAPDADEPQLRRAWLEGQLLGADGKPLGEDALKDKFAVMYRQYAGQDFDALEEEIRTGNPDADRATRDALVRAAGEQALLAAAPVGEDDLRALARQRAEVLRQGLLARGVAPDRLFLLDADLKAKSDKDGVPLVLGLSGG